MQPFCLDWGGSSKHIIYMHTNHHAPSHMFLGVDTQVTVGACETNFYNEHVYTSVRFGIVRWNMSGAAA